MKKEYIFAAISIFLWSTLAVTAKLLLGNYGNFQVLCISSLFAALSLFISVALTGRMYLFKKYSFKDVVIMTLAGLPGIFLYHVFYYGGASLLPASTAFVVNYLWPVMSIVFACIILKEKMTLKKMIAVFLSFSGVAVVSGGAANGVFGGIVLCILAAVSYGLFTALDKKCGYDKMFSMMINFCASFIFTVVYLVIKKENVLPEISDIPGFLWNGIFTMAIPNTTWTLALKYGSTAKISNLAYITPFISLIWSAIILKEDITLSCILGLVLIIAGILLQIFDGKQKVR